MSALKKWFDRRRAETSPAFGPIGVYLTQEYLHVVQLKRLDDGGIGFQSRVCHRYPGSRAELLSSPDAVRKLIRRAMRSGKFRGRNVISAMPPEQVRVVSISYPSSSAGNEVAAITRVMADRLDGALEDHVIDYVPIRTSSNDGDQLALVAVSLAADVDSYLSALDSAGLRIDHLEIAPLAIKRLIEWGSASGEFGNVIVLNVGDANSHLTTISGRRLLADQEIKMGEATILDALSSTLSLDRTQARQLIVNHGLDRSRTSISTDDVDGDVDISTTLVEIVKPVMLKFAQEIDRAFLFADSESRGNGAKRLIMVGSLSQWPGATTLISALADVKVEILGRNHLPKTMQVAEHHSIDDPTAADMSTAVGLAMRGMIRDERH